MTIRKLNDNECASDIEKIMLLTGEINFGATNLNDIIKTYQHLVRTENGNEFKQRLEEHLNALTFLKQGLYETRERFLNYMNGVDAVSEIDEQLSSVVYNTYHDQIEEED